jgi:hypothetical protein
MAVNQDFTWNQGEDFGFNVTYAVDGVAVDLTDYEARMDIAGFGPTGGYTNPLLTLDSDTEGAEITLDENGKIAVRIDRDDTLRLNGVAFAYDLFLRNKADDKQTLLMFGTITMRRAVTKWV